MGENMYKRGGTRPIPLKEKKRAKKTANKKLRESVVGEPIPAPSKVCQ